MSDKAVLLWSRVSEGVQFYLQDSAGHNIPFDQWGRFKIHTQTGRGSVAPLLDFYEQGLSEIQDLTLHVRDCQIAELDTLDVAALGLPPPAPLRLQVRGSGQIARPDFNLQYRWVLDDSRPALDAVREGVFIAVGGTRFLLLNPLFSIAEAIDHYTEAGNDVDEKFLRWAAIADQLPSDAIQDESLRNLVIIRADRFTLDVKEGSDFEPLLLRSEEAVIPGAPDLVQSVLPPVQHHRFSTQFASRDSVLSNYALGNGKYVVIPKTMQSMLQVVRDEQKKPAQHRQAFVSNPLGIIKERLRQAGADEAQCIELETVFEETPDFLSSRISELGVWEQKLCAYRKPVKTGWLPTEGLSINIVCDGVVHEVNTEKVELLKNKIQEAKAAGLETINFESKDFPVSDDFLESLNRVSSTKEQLYQNATKESKSGKKNLVPILIDNLDELEYKVEQRSILHTPGGLPERLKTVSLYPHQHEGIKWLQSHWENGSRGALLADDMGLGKTLQTLTFLAWLSESFAAGVSVRKPFLIVAPTGLLKNWEEECSLHLNNPGLGECLKAFGPSFSSFSALSHQEKLRRFSRVGWALTTYETLRDKIHNFIIVDWAVVVFDEAQKIKNPVSRTTEMAKSLQSDFTLMLTGTPVENELKDIWSITDGAVPGFLGSLSDFHHKYESGDRENRTELRDLMTQQGDPPVMLRRMKEDHLKGLPEKVVHQLPMNMPEPQRIAYDKIVSIAMEQRHLKGAMLKAIQHMRNCSLLPESVDPCVGLTDELIETSARLKVARKVMDDIYEKGEKLLIFLEDLKLQEYLVPYIQERYMLDSIPMRINGSVSGADRQSRVHKFQNGTGFDVMLISPKAGGVGLTLTAANHVIHLQRWWNPAVEDQCTDRVFRIGQKKTVHIYYPLAIHERISEKSFDNNLHRLLEKKRELSRSVLLPTITSSKDMEALFEESVSC